MYLNQYQSEILPNIPSILGFIGIILTYALNSKKDREIEIFKIKQKYYNALLESLVIKLSKVKLLKKINKDIDDLKKIKKLFFEIYKIKNISIPDRTLFISKFENLVKKFESMENFRIIEEIKEQINILNLMDSNLLLEETVNILKKIQELIDQALDFKIEEKKKMKDDFLEANKNFNIEASRVPLYASEEIINYIEKSKKPDSELILNEFYQLMRKDLSSGKVKKLSR